MLTGTWVGWRCDSTQHALCWVTYASNFLLWELVADSKAVLLPPVAGDWWVLQCCASACRAAKWESAEFKCYLWSCWVSLPEKRPELQLLNAGTVRTHWRGQHFIAAFCSEWIIHCRKRLNRLLYENDWQLCRSSLCTLLNMNNVSLWDVSSSHNGEI